MYSYSPIKTIQVKNFRNIGEATIDFTDSPIISLIGENESGKTSIVKAFGVCAMHADPRSQKDYIRDGTNGFGVAIELEDGTQVIRIKQANANRYTVRKADGTVVWDASKLENEVPKAVQDVMGLIEEPETKEFLHIRTYEDQLLFVVTPASTNYKVMYDALKISQITKAIKAGSTEANSLKSTINETDTSILTLRRSLSAIKTFDIEPLLNVRNKLQSEMQAMDKMDRVVSLLDEIDAKRKQLGALELLDRHDIKQIDTAEIVRLNAIDRLLDSIDSMKKLESAYSDLSSAEAIDVSMIMKMNNACDKIDSIEQMKAKSKSLVDLSKVEQISEVVVMDFARIDVLFDSIESLQRRSEIYSQLQASAIDSSEIVSIKKIDQALSLIDHIGASKKTLVEYDAYTEGVINWMKSIGVSATSCPKCGESIILDIGIQQ